jgi:hypothetical protein
MYLNLHLFIVMKLSNVIKLFESTTFEFHLQIDDIIFLGAAIQKKKYKFSV